MRVENNISIGITGIDIELGPMELIALSDIASRLEKIAKGEQKFISSVEREDIRKVAIFLNKIAPLNPNFAEARQLFVDDNNDNDNEAH